MKQFKDKVAVITGAASGIGRALADRCAQEGMKVVVADVEPQALARTAKELEAAGARVLAVPTDVSKLNDIEALAHAALDAFASVDLLCNNAGVAAPGSIWESTDADWEWVIGVNLWGVIHGIRVFVPIMLEQASNCHIVNTASMAGLIEGSGIGAYRVTKHGVVSLSETLYHELAEIGAKINVSVLCPDWVNTRIIDAERNRPRNLRNDATEVTMNPAQEGRWAAMAEAAQEGSPPHEVADVVLRSIVEEKFYILPHPDSKARVQLRMENILRDQNPSVLVQ